MTDGNKASAEEVTYRFFPGTGAQVEVVLRFDSRTHQLLVPAAADAPAWAKLDCCQCSNCPLDPATTRHCPTALGMASFLPAFANTVSHDTAVVEVETANRTIVAKTTLQAGLASLVGLVSASSGCPHTRFLRPMSRFHLPFATERETLFRAFSIWLLANYAAQRLAGQPAPPSLDGLKHRYEQLGIVNQALAERLRTVATRDAMLNAIVILDLFAQIAPPNIDGQMEDIMDAFLIER